MDLFNAAGGVGDLVVDVLGWFPVGWGLVFGGVGGSVVGYVGEGSRRWMVSRRVVVGWGRVRQCR